MLTVKISTQSGFIQASLSKIQGLLINESGTSKGLAYSFQGLKNHENY